MSGSRSSQVERSVSESGENACPVCHDPILIFAIGPCDHPVCHRCSTRMRVLCERNDCPICRAMTPQVAYVYHKQLFKDINLRNCIPNRKYKIFYEDEEVEDSYLDLLEFRCRICPNRGAEKTFALLQTHMRREHQMFACDLCVNHLKIFPFERKFYNRKNLATHRRIGDADDKSYKGHPLCEFCDSRYYDKDELMKHLRKDHYFCHFCDQQGSNAYYDQYENLMDHFADSHYLCTEGECGNPSTRFTHAFVSEIDLKAHKASTHGKGFTKAQSREARTLELDFQLPPRRRGGDQYTDARPRGGDRHNKRRDNREDIDLHRALEASKETFVSETAEARPPVAERVPDPVHDFPSLNGSAAAPAPSAPVAKTRQEDFPSLSKSRTNGSSVGSRHAPAPSMAYSSVMNPPAMPAPAPEKKESRPVPLGFVSSAAKGRQAGAYSAPPVRSEDDYPSLGGNGPRPVAANQGSWLAKSAASKTSASSVAASRTLAISKVPSTAAPVKRAAPFKKAVSDENEFPSLGGREKKKLSGLGNPFSEWSSVQNGAPKKTVTPRSERVEDDSFELPESYYTSVADPTASSNITMVEAVTEAIVKAPAKPAPTSNSSKDFPGLPAREKKTLEIANEKKKKKNNNKKARDKQNGPAKNPQEEANASLSEIALALVKPESKSTAGKKNSSSSFNEKSIAQKPTDWFDSSAEELREKSKPSPQQERKLNGSTHLRDLPPAKSQERKLNGSAHLKDIPPVELQGSEESSSSSIEDSFPSLHSMSTSVQLQPQQLPQPSLHSMSTSVQLPQGPPGFGPAPTAPAALPTPPPGFGVSANRLSDLKSISSTLTSVPAPPPGFTPNAPYVQPPDFKERNGQLIADIREALEPVEDGFMNFRTLSGQFRQGMMEASDYHYSVRTLMGAADFDRIFPELLALLPDVSKQKQLWEAHQIATSSIGNVKYGAQSSKSQKGGCGQVTAASDFQHHSRQHGDSENFPALNGLGREGAERKAAANSGLKLNGAWIKSK